MVEPAFTAIEAKQQGADLGSVRKIAEAAYHAVGRPHSLDLDHRPLTRKIWIVPPFGDDTIGFSVTCALQPGLSLFGVESGRREFDVVVF